MFLIAALVAFTLATIDAAFVVDWSLPWLIPAGLALTVAGLMGMGGAYVWPPPWRRKS